MEVFFRKPAWSSISVDIPTSTTSQEVLKLAELDDEVRLVPTYLGGDTRTVVIDGKETLVQLLGDKVKSHAVINVRTGEVLGDGMSQRYKVVQNRDAFRFCDSLVDDGHIVYEAAGSLQGGSLIWIMARMPGRGVRIKGVDHISPYLLLVNSHDGQSSFRALPLMQRLNCSNAVIVSMRKGRRRGISVQHSGNMEKKLEQAVQVFKQTEVHFDQFIEQAEIMAKREITDDEVSQFIESLFPEPKTKRSERTLENQETLYRIFYREIQSEAKEYSQIRNTAWDLFNAVTHYTNFHRIPPAASKLQGLDVERFRLRTLFFGGGSQLNQKALDYLLTLSVGGDPSNLLQA